MASSTAHPTTANPANNTKIVTRWAHADFVVQVRAPRIIHHTRAMRVPPQMAHGAPRGLRWRVFRLGLFGLCCCRFSLHTNR
jgi:hypothetical protein